MDTLINLKALERLGIALDRLGIDLATRAIINNAIQKLAIEFGEVAGKIFNLAISPRSKSIDAELRKRLEEISDGLNLPPRPAEFVFLPGEGIKLPEGFDFPQLRLPCPDLVRPNFSGPIFERFLEFASPQFDQDELWRSFHTTFSLQVGLNDLYEAVALGDRLLSGDNEAFNEMREFVVGTFGGQPQTYRPRPPFGPEPWPHDWGHGALPCIRPDIEENIPELLRRFCPPWTVRPAARNLTMPERGSSVCEGDLIEITATFQSTPWVEVLFPYQPAEVSFLPQEADGLPLHPTLVTLRNETLVSSDRHSYLVTRIDRSARIEGNPALTNDMLQVQVPPSLRRNEPGLHTPGVLHGDRIPVVLRRPCLVNPSGDPQLATVTLDFIPAPHVVSITGNVIGCRRTATLRWRTQGVEALQLRILGGDDWISVVPATTGEHEFLVDGLFSTGARYLDWEASGEGTCKALTLRRGKVPVRYELSASLSQESIPVDGQTILTLRRPACVSDPHEPWTVTLSSTEERGIVEHPDEVTIPAGATEATVELVGKETGNAFITLGGSHIIEQMVTIDVNHEVRSIPDAAISLRCEDVVTIGNDTFVNWHHNIIRRNIRVAFPQTVSHLANAIRTADAQNWEIGVVGSGWSYTRCGVSNDTELLISTDKLTGELTDTWRRTVLRRNLDIPAEHLVHVLAGTKIFQINCLLAHEKSPPLMLPTMGGSNGQSIAGVIGTSVHGSHFNRPPVADAIRAIHLVGPDGRQWWIEPTTDSITNPSRMADARESGQLCPSTQIVYDDALFNATLVSLGTAGVMYSLVVACEPNRNIATRTEEVTWTQAKLDIDEIIIRERPPRLGAAQVDFLELIIDPATQTGRKTIRAYTDEAITPPPSMLSSSDDDTIYWATRALLRALAIDPGAVIGVAGATVVLATSTVFSALLIAVSEWIARKSAEALINPTVLGELAEVTADFSELMFDLALRPFSLEGLAAAAPNLINLMWRLGVSAASGAAAVAALQRFMISELRPETTHPTGYTVGRNDEVLTNQVRKTNPTTGITTCEGNQHGPFERLIASYEYVVSISRLNDFMEGFERDGRHIAGLFEIYDELRGNSEAFVATYNLRFTERTRATLGIQRFPKSAHVEVYTVDDLRGNRLFRRRLFQLVREIGAVPHMGQLHEVGARIPEVFGASLPAWREQIERIADESGGRRDLFWSRFHAQAELLP
ncbi:MAG: FAD-binding protein [Cyanobacteria bacterium P01_H01_bin.58]